MGWPELIQGVHRKSVYNSNVAYKIMNKSIAYNTVHTDTYCNFKTIINLLELISLISILLTSGWSKRFYINLYSEFCKC